MKQSIYLRICGLWIAVLFTCCGGYIHAQAPHSRTVLVGQAGFFTDYYWTDNFPAAYSIYHRPTLLNRLVLDAQMGRGKWDVPMNIQLTAPFSHADRIPAGPTNAQDYLMMPGNVVRIAPSFRKLKFQFGNFMPTLSPLTTGNIPNALGVGVEFTPGWLRIKGSYGITHRPVGYLVPMYPGQYERRMVTVQIGLGDDAKTHFRFNFVRGWDMERQNMMPGSAPAEGNVLSADFRVKPKKSPFYLAMEIALATHTADRNDTGAPCDQLSQVPLHTNFSTVGDAAIHAEIGMRLKGWTLVFQGKYIGANYRTMAYLYQVLGHLDWTASTDLRLFKQKLYMTAAGGLRRTFTPINHTIPSIPISDQALLRANAHIQLTRWLGFDGHFSNYAWQDSAWQSRRYILQTTRSQGIAATLQWGRKTKHTLTGTAIYDAYRDYYWVLPDPDGQIQASILGFRYQLRHANQSGLTLGGNQFDYNGDFDIRNYGWTRLRWNAYAGIQRNFFKNHCQMRMQMQVSWDTLAFPVVPDLLAPSLAVDLKLTKKLRWTIEADGRRQTIAGNETNILFVRNALQFQF